MKFIPSNLPEALSCLNVLEEIRLRYSNGIETFDGSKPKTNSWFRNKGQSGGGTRFEFDSSNNLTSSSLNISQVHYDESDNKAISSATALSTIIHPYHPSIPSMHMHISMMTKFDNTYYWRIMADLNPSIPNEKDKELFENTLIDAGEKHASLALETGRKYFYIPILNRYRGVSHFYLENYNSSIFEEDLRFAERFGMYVITTYLSIINSKKNSLSSPTEEQKKIQLAYHTLYFFQVLILDRGTTVGLLSHNENDIGIFGSLPKHIDKNLLKSWVSRLSKPQDLLLERLLQPMPNTGIIEIDVSLKKAFAEIIRNFYLEYPEVLKFQAESPISLKK